MNTVYKKFLGVAFKHCKELEECPRWNEFMSWDTSLLSLPET